MKCWYSRILILYFITACSRDEQNIQKIFELLTYPQNAWNGQDYGEEPSSEFRNRLKKYAPSFWISAGSCGPMDFYRQYVPMLSMWRHGKPYGSANRSMLKKFERDFSVEYELSTSPLCIEDPKPPLYAYAWMENMELAEGQFVPIQVLKFAFTFYKSGLPAELGLIQGLGFLGSNDLWHYLDIHGAVFIMLSQAGEAFAVVLAQHNHFRTFIVGEDVSIAENLEVCFAKRSNEPYLCKAALAKYPTAPTWQAMKFIVTGEDKPFLGAYDLVPGKNEAKNISYRLEYLASKDPLITSWVPLGPEIKIWGVFSSFFRKSPPGMAIYTTPALTPFSKTAQYFYFDHADEQAFNLHAQNMNEFLSPEVEPVLSRNRRHFVATLQKSGFFRK